MDSGGFQGILFCEIEEPSSQLDLVRLTHRQHLISQDGTAHLKAWNSFFQNNMVVICKGQLQGGRQLAPLQDLCDPVGGTGPDGLDKQRIAQRFPFGHSDCDAHPSFQNSRPGNLHPCSLGQLVGAVFVHAQCRGQHTAAHQRDTRQLKEALHRPVLSVPTVEDRERGVQVDCLYIPRPKHQEGRGAPIRAHDGRNTGFRIMPSVAFNAVHRAGVVEPIARLGNAHHHRLIPALSHVPENGGGRLEGHPVLRGTAAEQDGNFQPAHSSPCLSARYSSRHRPFSYISVAASTPT